MGASYFALLMRLKALLPMLLNLPLSKGVVSRYLSVVAAIWLVGCVSPPMTTSDARLRTLSDLVGLNKQRVMAAEKQTAQNRIRMMAVRDSATSFGARSGLAWRAKQINDQLSARVAYLDKVFNFQHIMLEKHVLPPVLVEGHATLNLATPHSIRIADSTYRIVKQARFTTTPPTWRTYLFTHADPPQLPDATLLPKDSTEQVVWDKYVTKGWSFGITQANDIYEENLNRLKRDYQGMIRYRQLLAQNMVSAPQVAERDMGVTGGGEEMSINDRVLTIKALPALKADSEQWKPAVTH